MIGMVYKYGWSRDLELLWLCIGLGFYASVQIVDMANSQEQGSLLYPWVYRQVTLLLACACFPYD